MTPERGRPNYVAVWLWLVGLMIASVVVSYLPLGRSALISLIFVLAAVKALLVALNYMHLKYEKPLICAIAAVPLFFVLVLTLLLFPDIVLR